MFKVIAVRNGQEIAGKGWEWKTRGPAARFAAQLNTDYVDKTLGVKALARVGVALHYIVKEIA